MENKYSIKYDSLRESFEEVSLTCLVAITVIGAFLSVFLK
jgi:hypothetical protein